MENRILRFVSGVLLVSSMITHVAQVFFVGTESHSLAAAGYGVLYGIVGVALLVSDRNKYVFLLGALLPAIGGVLGSIRFVGMITVENTVNYFIIYHLFVDVIVVPSCLVLYQRVSGGLPTQVGAVVERVGR